MKDAITFRQLELPRDADLVAKSGNSPLEVWYRSVRDKSIHDFTHEDLSKALRQQLYPELVVPAAIHTLKSAPLAGELYDGEMLAAMKSIDKRYWPDHRSQALEVA